MSPRKLPALMGAAVLAAVSGVAAAAAAPPPAAPPPAPPAPPAPRAPEGYDTISRELRIGADVLRAALAEGLPGSKRVLTVEAGYLAGQGVLVIVELANPWLSIDGGNIEVGPDLRSLEHIPELVQDILDDLNLGLSKHQVEDLEELREIRAAQRAIRAEQRATRAQLREKRRALLREDNAQVVKDLREEIERLEAELTAAEEEERQLVQDAATVRDTLDAPPPPAAESPPGPGNLDLAVAEAVCGYGATFRSLGSGDRLSVLVRQTRVSRYYVFEMGEVRGCQKGDLKAERLLEEAYVYES